MEYRQEIDGLRAIAVLPVILFHAGFEYFRGGFVGVDVFFIISGYLITSIILYQKKSGKFSLLTFYERRARRILPSLFFVMLMCLPFAWICLQPQDQKDFLQSLVAVSLFASNVLFWLKSGYFAESADLKPLLHTWSLSLEEQYYLIFPLLIILLWRFKKNFLVFFLVFLALGSFCLGQWGAYHQPTAAFYLLPMRGWELLMGALTALYAIERSPLPPLSYHRAYSELMSLLGMGLIIYAICQFSEKTPFPSVYTLIPTVGTVLILLFANKKNVIGKLLSYPVLVGIGLISYSAYLWHQPLFAFARHYSLNDPTPTVYLLLTLLTLILAYGSWAYIEKPFRNPNIIRQQWIIVGSFGFAIFFIILGLLLSKNTLPSAHYLDSFDISRDLKTTEECPSHLFPEAIKKHCSIIGTKGVTPTILLMGDSHAEALRGEFEKSLLEKQRSAYSITLGGCTPVKNVSLQSEFFFDECIHLNRWLSDTILYDKDNPYDIKTVIIFSRWTAHLLDAQPFDNHEGGKEKELFTHSNNIKLVGMIDNKMTYEKALIHQLYLEHFRNIHIPNIILVYPMPEAGWHIPHALAKLIHRKGIDNIKADTLSTSYELYKQRNHQATLLLDSVGTHIIRIRPEHFFCDSVVKGRCITHIHASPLYYDDDHISNKGAHWVMNEIMRSL